MSNTNDLLIIETIAPEDFKSQAKALEINYSSFKTQFGQIIIASIKDRICYLGFCENEQDGLTNLKRTFSGAIHEQSASPTHQQVLKIFNNKQKSLPGIKLALRGTPFQLKIWRALLEIPSGSVATYADIAKKINQPKATRAVANAIGRNPVALLIPCHRVIQSNGQIGGYHWGAARKEALLSSETTKQDLV